MFSSFLMSLVYNLVEIPQLSCGTGEFTKSYFVDLSESCKYKDKAFMLFFVFFWHVFLACCLSAVSFSARFPKLWFAR